MNNPTNKPVGPHMGPRW